MKALAGRKKKWKLLKKVRQSFLPFFLVLLCLERQPVSLRRGAFTQLWCMRILNLLSFASLLYLRSSGSHSWFRKGRGNRLSRLIVFFYSPHKIQ